MRLEHIVGTAALALAMTGCIDSRTYPAIGTVVGRDSTTLGPYGISVRKVVIKSGDCTAAVEGEYLYGRLNTGQQVRVTRRDHYVGNQYTGCSFEHVEPKLVLEK